MLTAPDWALGSRYLRENAPELIPFIENTALAIYSRKPRKIFWHACYRYHFPTASAGCQPGNGQAPGRNRRNAHNAGINSLCRRKRFMQLRYYAAEGNVS